MPPPDRDRTRRSFLVTAVALGSSVGLSACLAGESSPDIPRGTEDLSSLPDRQHAWNGVLRTDDHGNHLPPRHRVLLLLDLQAEGEPGADTRETVKGALRSLERAYERSPDGLLFTISYSPAYFQRFEDSLPTEVELPEPRALAPFEDPVADRPDAVLHLAGDHAEAVLEAEEGLRGNQSTVNGVEMEASLSPVLEVADRRTGFVGKGLPQEHQDAAGIPASAPIPEDAPMFMGFDSGFTHTQASEDRVTIQSGPFADGTTQQLSTLRLHLDQWYEQDSRYHREASMFCPHLADEGAIEGDGSNLGKTGGMDRCPAHSDDALEERASEAGIVGHSQKMLRTRDESGPPLLRRDFNSTDDGRASLHFLSLQRTIADFVRVREAMNGTDLAASTPVGQRTNNGILQYFSVETRGNYLVPPRSSRALPTPDGDPENR